MSPAPAIGAAPDSSERDPTPATRVRAPGKLILMGEHSAVYGEPALVCALGLHLSIALEPAAPSKPVRILLPSFSHDESTSWEALVTFSEHAAERWRAFAADPAGVPFSTVGAGGGAGLTRLALGEAARAATGRLPGCTVRVEGELPHGAGFGSSAALAVGLLLACRAAFSLPWTDEALEAAALDVERRQHGLPSGVDGATVLRGGVVWAERADDGSLRVTPSSPDADHMRRFRILHTGTPRHPTGDIVAAVRERVEGEGPHARARLARMGSTTREFRRVIEGGGRASDAVRLIRSYHADLDALGVVSPRVRERIAAAEAAGGAAKISGAGALDDGAAPGEGGGSILAYHPEQGGLDAWLRETGATPIDAALGVAGAQVLP